MPQDTFYERHCLNDQKYDILFPRNLGGNATVLKLKEIESRQSQSNTCHVAVEGERCQRPARNFPVGHSLMVIHRLI